MAAPLSGIVGTQQQVPAAQAIQPAVADQSRQVRQTEQVSREDEIQPPGAETNQAQASVLSERSFSDTIQEANNPQESALEPRGSRLDISI